ncbi:unnamed protein product, partial [Ectocarpus sp. 12 AP-2014]
MTTSQRAKASFRTIKTDARVGESATFRAVRESVDRLAQNLALESRYQQHKATGWPYVDSSVKQIIKPIMTECEKAGASSY